jgi:hypothetical protein|tara:strand:- start:6044 stop:6385 length:342 start_codon:yes stop_codon:yes gene_type:complete
MTFENNIKQWVHLDNEIKILNEQTRKLREQRTQLHDIIITDVQDKHLEQSTIQISDGQLKFSSSKITKPLTLKYVQTCLEDIINEKDTVIKIINYIKTKREVNISKEIKRFYN